MCRNAMFCLDFSSLPRLQRWTSPPACACICTNVRRIAACLFLSLLESIYFFLLLRPSICQRSRVEQDGKLENSELSSFLPPPFSSIFRPLILFTLAAWPITRRSFCRKENMAKRELPQEGRATIRSLQVPHHFVPLDLKDLHRVALMSFSPLAVYVWLGALFQF